MSGNPRLLRSEKHTFCTVRTTNQNQARLSPTEAINNSLLYHAGFESDRNGVDLHMIVTTPTQVCIVGSTRSESSDVAKFKQNFNSIVARELNQVQGQSGYFWRDRSYFHRLVLTTEDLVETLADFMTRPVREGLVDDHNDWQGLTVMNTDEGDHTIDTTRPDFCGRRSSKPQEFQVRLRHSEILAREQVTPAEFLTRVNKRIEQKTREYLAAREQQDPNNQAEPLTPQEQQALDPLATHQPRFQIELPIQSEVDFAEYRATSPVHLLEEQRQRDFRRAYRHAFREWQLATDKNSVNFPIGTYKMRVIHNISCTAPYALE